MRVEYSSNNSGGKWWLSDDDWRALEAAGWVVNWVANETDHVFSSMCKDGRWLGALARSASREGVSLEDAVAEWERVTGECALDAGCPCCGNPHTFTEYDSEGNHVRSGPGSSYSCEW